LVDVPEKTIGFVLIAGEVDSFDDMVVFDAEDQTPQQIKLVFAQRTPTTMVINDVFAFTAEQQDFRFEVGFGQRVGPPGVRLVRVPAYC
jgi:hypothetical protein